MSSYDVHIGQAKNVAVGERATIHDTGTDVSADPRGERPVTRVLFLAANPMTQERLSIDREVRDVDAALRLSEHRDHIALEVALAARPRDLRAALLRHQPAVLHFSGHGSDAGEIVLESDEGVELPVAPELLGALVRAIGSSVRLVVLNACWSDEQAEALAQAVGCVVGMRDEIEDDAAVEFSVGFYETLSYGRSVRAAFDAAVAGIDLQLLEGADIPQLRHRDDVDPGILVLV